MLKKSLIAGALFGMAAAANAATFDLLPGGSTGEMPIDGSSFTLKFNSLVDDANAKLSFVLQGYRTVDGINDFADQFSLAVNGKDVGTGFFNFGGGGVTWSYHLGTPVVNGSTASFSDLGVSLLKGQNTFTFTYTPIGASNGGGQGLADEAWGLKSASVMAAVPEPEVYAMMTLGLGLIGFVSRRNKKSV